ncbi:MAG: hypothetical protein V3S64_16515 [bacterium]
MAGFKGGARASVDVLRKLTALAIESGFVGLPCWSRTGGLDNRTALPAMDLPGGEILPPCAKVIADAASPFAKAAPPPNPPCRRHPWQWKKSPSIVRSASRALT